jgi:hypothetical protein
VLFALFVAAELEKEKAIILSLLIVVIKSAETEDQ